MEFHNIPPVYDKNSRVLVLGSFPSVKSREERFFYAHPQNRFWRVTAAVFGCDTPKSIAEKRTFLLENHIAVWDVIASCDISGSSDASISNVIPNDISPILNTANIGKFFCNGTQSAKYYKRYIFPQTGIAALKLPSTSPANASWSFDRLVGEWSVLRLDL